MNTLGAMATPLAKTGPAAQDPARLGRAAASASRPLRQLLEGLEARDPRTKYGCAKALALIAQSRPASLYPFFDHFVRLLDHQNKILQWEATLILAHLAAVDAGNRFEPIFEKYFAPISGPVMITAANVIKGGARIARAQPRLADRIAAELLKVAHARYRTPECRNVAIGHAIRAFGDMLYVLQNPVPVIQSVRKQVKNPRPATRRKAEEFLKRAARHAQNYQA